MKNKGGLNGLHWALIGALVLVISYKKTVTIETTNSPVKIDFNKLLNNLFK